MIFEKIGKGLTKHHKLVIVAWIVALVISVPAILQVNSVLSYEQNGVTAGNYESVKAQEIISANFRQSVSNGTILMLLQGDNVTDAASRDLTLALQKELMASNEIKELQNVSSVYSITEMVMNQTIMQLGPSIRPAEQQINMTAFLLWGIPAMHAANWASTQSDSNAYDLTKAQLTALLAQQSDQNTTAMALGYYSAFAAAWNATAGNASLADPQARATYCVNAVAPGFIASLPSEARSSATAVFNGFNLTDFNNQAKVHAFALSMIGSMASISNTTFLQEVYDLGPSYMPSAVEAYVLSVIGNGTLATYPIQVPQELLTNFVSANNRTMLVALSFGVASDYTTKDGDKPLIDDVKIIRNIANNVKTATGSPIAVYTTGDAAISSDMQQSAFNDIQLIAPITIIIILVLMGILFRSILGQFLPLGAVGIALGISQALVFVIGSTVGNIDSTSTIILFAVLMGVGADYSIFIITRFREEEIKGASRKEAVQTAVTWAGESIVTSGATVIIAFFAMSLASISMVKTMGLIVGLGVIVALLVSLTLIPAILMLVGNRVFWPTTGERFKRFATRLMEKKKAGNHGYFHQAASFAVKHSKIIIIVALLASIPSTYIYLTSEPSYDFIGSMGNPESVQGMNAMTADFGAGKIAPTQVVITGNSTLYDGKDFNLAYLDAVDNVTTAIAADPMVKEVTGLTRPYGQPIDYHNLSALPEETRQQLVQGMLQSMGNDNESILLTVVLKDQPMKSSSVNFIPIMRSELADAKAEQPALTTSSIYVGGTTASIYDMSTSTSEQFTSIEMIVILGIFIVLMIVLGSILLPAFAVLSIAMSITWSFALTTLVFGTGMSAPILFMIPLVLFIMLMGLGMDYNIFILTRIREEAHKGKGTEEAVVDAVDWTGGIITALALIMAGAFGSMMLSSNTMLQEFGFALSVAILLDAMVVRTYIVPAAMKLMGKWAWWAPGRLQRVGRAEKMLKNGRQKTD